MPELKGWRVNQVRADLPVHWVLRVRQASKGRPAPVVRPGQPAPRVGRARWAKQVPRARRASGVRPAQAAPRVGRVPKARRVNQVTRVGYGEP